ncbi:MAG: hypothetical protein IKG27_00460 [Bacilli bacterium]|nr:hypothetical protein [Bacilli bacterium]
MKKSLKIIGVFVLIIIILVFLGCIWAKGLKKDQRITKEKMKLIIDAYPKFDESVNMFSDKRNILYEFKDELYFETLSENVTYWNTFIDEYAEGIKKLEEASKVLKKNCVVNFGDVNTNSKCTAFKANYEAAHNYYISDAISFNKLVENYDEWNEKNGNKAEQVKKANFPVYKKYIDYDKDGEYFGKVEVKDNE